LPHRFLYGEAEYDTYTATPFQAKRAIATIYFILYIAVTLLLLVNLITAMILHVFKGQQTYAKRVWLLRWASFVLRWVGCRLDRATSCSPPYVMLHSDLSACACSWSFVGPCLPSSQRQR
jgi:hypothetical protein